MIELSSSNIRDFKLSICEGRVVVRSYTRISGLIGVREEIPDHLKGLLAIPVFSGNGANEVIYWTTDMFSSTPTRMSELSDDRKKQYRKILTETLRLYAEAFSDAKEDVKRLLYAAVTYISDESVFCGEGKVVLTEWGVTPSSGREAMGMPICVDSEYDNPEKPREDQIKEDIKPDSEGDTMITEETLNRKQDSPLSPEIPKENLSENNQDEPPAGKRKRKFGLWHWILLALILAAGVLIFFFFNGCASPMKSVVAVNPELSADKIVISKDSINYIVSDRLLLIVGSEHYKLEDFVKEFRKDYPDSKKYILSAPDTLLKRVTLTLPDAERETLEQDLPVKYNSFELIVIPDGMFKSSSAVPSDPDFRSADKRWYFDECGVFDAWDVTMGDKDVVVAVIDDGFDLEHSELKGRAYLPFNAVDHSAIVEPSPSGHGTHVASTAIGSVGNQSGMSGIAPKCRFMPIQVGDRNGNMSTAAILDGVLYAIANGADVVNMSLGMYFGPGVQFMPVYLQDNIRNYYFKQEEAVWNRIFEMARQKDVTFVLAGGNENILIGVDPMSRSNATIKVSAVGNGGEKAGFSNYGDLSTVSAPGVQIYNAVPGDTYEFMDGTSMAAPIVAGGCALLKSHDPTLSTHEMIDILRSTGNRASGPIGPVVNFARALNQNEDEAVADEDGSSCSDISKRYSELMAELEALKRDHPGCITRPDTMAMPVNLTLEGLKGKWKSTTVIQNYSNEDLVIYFTFNGSSDGRLDVVEPSGIEYSAPLKLRISEDIIYIDQTSPATNTGRPGGYNPYRFVIRPDKNRRAEGKANNKVEAYNAFNFSLVRI
ncbi:MAG: S8 family serine peptidase [Muribaculaceae bacterium]|nr:S8 family serine peptidase [Muribaculaceae bacterium]